MKQKMEKKIRGLAPEIDYLNKKRSKNENKEKQRGRNQIYQENLLELQCRSSRPKESIGCIGRG